MGRATWRLVCVVVLVAVVSINVLVFLSSADINPMTQDILLDPNAPVILVADDGEDRPEALPQAAPPGARPGAPPRARPRTPRPALVNSVLLKPGAATDKFLVHSYDHGGGGVASQALNLLLDDIFFLYQPLYKLAEQEPIPAVHRLTRDKAEQGVKWLHQIFNCSVERHRDLLHEPFLWKSQSVRNTYIKECQHRQVELGECVERACHSRTLHAVYTLRLGMTHILQLLKRYTQHLKVVLVLRDPRAVLSARRRAAQRININTPIDFKAQASVLCATMAADLDVVNHMHKLYPDSVMVLHYEHLVRHSRQVLAYLYDFLGLQVTSDRLERIIKILRLDRSEELLLQLSKMWQLDLTLQESRAVDEGCTIHYDQLGYLPVPDTINTKNNNIITWDQARMWEDKQRNISTIQ
nr:uncharacterized protein LOC123773408 [Procambarus clarkii]XP_045623111.1 uncharacterized protein LOC123773408 [Procambarus clarkii]